jgi:hypothetical protein
LGADSLLFSMAANTRSPLQPEARTAWVLYSEFITEASSAFRILVIGFQNQILLSEMFLTWRESGLIINHNPEIR